MIVIDKRWLGIEEKGGHAPGFIGEHAEVIWLGIMLVLVMIFFSWSVIGVTTGSSTSYRYGMPLFSGLPSQAQVAVREFQASPPKDGTSEVINGILVVNMTVTQSNGFNPDVIVAKPGEQVVIIENSPDVVTGFYLRLPDGVVNVNTVPGVPSYIYFPAPSAPGNYTWREPEYGGYDFSYWTGTLEVVQ